MIGGAEGIRTPDPHNAIVVLYQLSYDPNQKRTAIMFQTPLGVNRLFSKITFFFPAFIAPGFSSHRL